MDKFKRYYHAVNYLEGLFNIPRKSYMSKRKNPKIFLNRMQYFLDLLENPEKNFKYIHVTGTSGKGSVCNMIHSVLVSSGKKAGLFTSPFATTTIEKIKVNELYADPIEFAEITEEIKPLIDKAYVDSPYGGPSYFEIFFAIALLYFKKKRCSWVVLEVGMGGKYDATNIIKNSVITVITNVNYDHIHVLGKTLQKIALEKSAIVKEKTSFWTTETKPQILKIFNKVCQEKEAKFNQVKGKNYKEKNLALVNGIAEKLGIKKTLFKKGILKPKLPCRFELMQKNPKVVLDGAHNPSKIKSTIYNLKIIDYKKLHLVIGISKDKNTDKIMELIAPFADYIYITRFNIIGRKCAHPLTLKKQAEKYNPDAKIKVYLDAEQALDKAINSSKKKDLVLVTGSFFLTGKLRERWYPEEYVLEKRRSF
jgi:dihydrofolate synthase/folylpolyglutamate synthase